MKGSLKLMCGVCAVVLGLWAGEARADVTLYGDRAAFEAALRHAATYTFEVGDGFPQAPTDANPGPPPPLTSWDGGRIHFSGFDGALATVQVRPDLSQFAPPYQYLAGVSGVSFVVPQIAIGFDAVSVGGGTNALITLEFGEAAEMRSFEFHDINNSGLGFFGVISDAPIASFYIDPRVPGITHPWSGIDNLTVQAIPDPGVFLMPVFAGGFLLVSRKRR